VHTDATTSPIARLDAAASFSASGSEAWVAPANDAVDGVGRQRGEVVLGGQPGGVVTASGGDHGQWLAGEIGQGLGLRHCGRGLAEFVERAAHLTGGGAAGPFLVPRLWRQAAVAGEARQPCAAQAGQRGQHQRAAKVSTCRPPTE
jgi:hypothetical protein